MKVNPITNNTTFSSKIKYNETMQKGFELAKEAAKSPTKKNIDFAKTFSDNIRTILNDGRNDSIVSSSFVFIVSIVTCSFKSSLEARSFASWVQI